MAIRALNSVVVANYDVAANASWSAGAVLVRDYVNAGRVVIGTRSALGSSTGVVGLSADDTARTGNTMILADPVGSSYVDSSNVLQAANNGFYTVAKRAIGDFQAEIVNNVTNPSAQSSGFEGPRRGVGVYNTPGGQFVTDMFLTGAGSSANNIYTDTQSAVYAPGAPLTFAANGSGKLVEAGVTAGVQNGGFVGGFGGTAAKLLVGFVDRYDSAAGLLYFTQA
jgi:hypothetical protein